MPKLPKYICMADTTSLRYRYYLPNPIARQVHGCKWRSGSFPSLEEAINARDTRFAELGIQHYISGGEPGGVETVTHGAPQVVESADGCTATVICNTPQIITTFDELLDKAEIDRDIWEIAESPKPVLNAWPTTNGEGEQFQNFQIKVSLQRKTPIMDVDYFCSLLQDMPVAPPTIANASGGDHLLEINICDLHLGKLCWAGETGEDFDLKIAEQRFVEAVTRLSSLASAFDVEKILFPIGSDYFHSDNFNNTTTKGTALDCDVRFPKLYEKGVQLLIWAVDYLRKYAPVDVVLVPGNHDRQTGFCAAVALDLYFGDCDDVTVDSSPTARKYIRYHNNLVGLFHGDAIKAKDVFAVAAAECNFWSDVQYREMHAGHYHHESVKEYPGLVVRYLSSLSGTDAWHHLNGFVGTRKAAQAFVYSRRHGVVSNLTCSV